MSPQSIHMPPLPTAAPLVERPRSRVPATIEGVRNELVDVAAKVDSLSVDRAIEERRQDDIAGALGSLLGEVGRLTKSLARTLRRFGEMRRRSADTTKRLGRVEVAIGCAGDQEFLELARRRDLSKEEREAATEGAEGLAGEVFGLRLEVAELRRTRSIVAGMATGATTALVGGFATNPTGFVEFIRTIVGG